MLKAESLVSRPVILKAASVVQQFPSILRGSSTSRKETIQKEVPETDLIH